MCWILRFPTKVKHHAHDESYCSIAAASVIENIDTLSSIVIDSAAFAAFLNVKH